MIDPPAMLAFIKRHKTSGTNRRQASFKRKAGTLSESVRNVRKKRPGRRVVCTK